MDTSVQYISMCRKAVELQKLIQLVDHRSQGYCTKHECLLAKKIYCSIPRSDFYNVVSEKTDHVEKMKKWKEECGFNHWITLFNQDQLINAVDWNDSFHIQMGKSGCSDKFHPAIILFNSKDEIVWVSDDQEASWEQLWLKFVMFLKYDKKWTGNEWKKSV